MLATVIKNLCRNCFAEGRQLAITSNCKYIETSCAISLNVDFLLAGIGAQANLKNSSKFGKLEFRGMS